MATTKALAAVALAGLAVAGCGSTSAPSQPSPRQQIQAVERTYLAAVKADDAGAMCRLTADHNACLEAVVTLRVLGLKPSDQLKGDEEHRIATLKVRVSGNHARTARGHELVRRDGRWLLVLARS